MRANNWPAIRPSPSATTPATITCSAACSPAGRAAWPCAASPPAGPAGGVNTAITCATARTPSPGTARIPAPCPQPRPRAEELDAAVWDHVKGLLDDPSTLAAQFEERARQADALDADANAAGQKWEAQLRRLDREEQRLLDAYQAEAIDLDELKQRRDQINSRKHLLSLQRDQEQRLRSERQTAKEVWADLTAFCERAWMRLDGC